jgi:hypothetical protein
MANAEHMGEKGSSSDTKAARPVDWSPATINLPRPLFLNLMEDPIIKLHNIDRLMDAIYCHLQDYELWEESKRRQESKGKNSVVKIQNTMNDWKLQAAQVRSSNLAEKGGKDCRTNHHKKGALPLPQNNKN